MAIKMTHIGYEIREQYGNDPLTPIQGYPLPTGNITMDSNLCRPCFESGYNVNGHRIYLYNKFLTIKNIYLSIEEWYAHGDIDRKKPSDINSYRIFSYYVETAMLNPLIELEKHLFKEDFSYFSRVPTSDKGITHEMNQLGYDVVRGLWHYDRWESEIANEGIPLKHLVQFGAINKHGLYDTFDSALAFKHHLRSFTSAQETDLPFIVRIEG